MALHVAAVLALARVTCTTSISFETHAITANADGAAYVAAADLDADGDTDVVAALYRANAVVWYFSGVF